MNRQNRPGKQKILLILALVAAVGLSLVIWGPSWQKEKPELTDRAEQTAPEVLQDKSTVEETAADSSTDIETETEPEPIIVETVMELVETAPDSEPDLEETPIEEKSNDFFPFISVRPLGAGESNKIPVPISEPEPEAVLPPAVKISSEEPEQHRAPEPDPEPVPEAVIPAIIVLKPEIAAEPETEPEPTPEPAPRAIAPLVVVPEPLPELEPVAPEVTETASLAIDTPMNGDIYNSFVTVSGRTIGLETLSWTAPAVGAEGVATPDENGQFSFSVNTVRFRDNLVILISGEAANGERLESRINMVNDRKGPTLAVEGVSDGTFYKDFLSIKGVIRESSESNQGVGEVESLTWRLTAGNNPPRTIFFNPDGTFEFRIDMRDVSDSQTLVLSALDLNGNATEKRYSLIDGRLDPGLQLSGPGEEDVYGAALRLWGRVDDPYRGIGELGGIESLRYEIVDTDDRTRAGLMQGDIEVSPDGSFDLSMFTDDLQGQQTVTLIVTGRNGRTRTETITLDQGQSSIPDFSVESGDSKVLASWNPLPLVDEYELTVSGKDKITKRYSITGGPVEIPGLENGELYDFRVEAVSSRGRFLSHEESAIPLSAATLQPIVTGEYRRIKVSWSEIPGSDAYAVYRADSRVGPFELIAEAVAEPPYLDTRAQYGKTYWYSLAPAAFRDIKSNPESGSTLAAQANRLEQVAFLRGYETWNLSVVGDYAYGAAGDQGLVLFDVTESTSPSVTGRSSFQGALDVAVQGNYAYVASGSGGLKVLNIDDPTEPLQIGSRLAGEALAIDLAGSYAYIADGERGLRIMDVHDPTAPIRLSSTEGLSGRDVIVRGRHAFLAAGDDGLVVVDIGIPSQPEVAAVFDRGSLTALAIRDNLLVASGVTGGLILLDIVDPVNPVLLSQIADVNAHQIDLAGDFVLALGEEVLHVVDIRVPEDPFLFDSFPMDSSMSLAIHGDDLLVSSRTGLEVYRTFLTGQSYVTGGRDLSGRPYNVLLDDRSLYVASHRGGVSVLSTSSFEPVAVLETDYAEQVALSGPWLYVADGISGISVYRRNALADGPVVRFENLGHAADIISIGDSVFAATSEQGLVKLGSGGADSLEPSITGTADLINCRALSAAGDYIYATNGSDIVSFVDLPGSAPREIGRLALSEITSLDAEGSLVAASGNNGVSILHTDGQGNLQIASTLNTGSAAGVQLVGKYLYISGGYNGLSIYDISKPTRPILVSSCPEVFAVSTVVDGDIAYAADGDGVREIQIFIPDWLQ